MSLPRASTKKFPGIGGNGKTRLLLLDQYRVWKSRGGHAPPLPSTADAHGHCL